MSHRFVLPVPGPAEQMRAVLALSATLALLAALTEFAAALPLLPAFAASAVLAMALPSAPVAKPRALIGGTLIGAVIAWAFNFLHLPVWVAAPLAGGLALWAMYRLRCLHPPAGALMLGILLSPNTFAAPSKLGLLLAAALVTLLGAIRLRQSFSEHATWQPASKNKVDLAPTHRQEPTPEQWQQTLDNHAELLDIAPAQLQTLYREVEAMRLKERAGVLRVGDIMSRKLVTLPPNATAQQAWQKLQMHRIKTIPVVADGVVIGVIALVDLLKHLRLSWPTLPEDLNERANIVLAQDVETLMSKPARTVRADLPLDALVPLLSDWGLHHLPVVDEQGGPIGIVTQSDLIAGLARLLNEKP